MGTRAKATAEEIAEAGSAAGVRQKATPEEAAEASSASSVSPDTTPSTGRAVAEGALQGGSYGFGDEVQGLIGAVLRRAPGLAGYPSPEEQGEENIFAKSGFGNSFVDDYRNERDAAQRDSAAAKNAHPAAFNTSQIAAAILTPGPKPGKTVGSFAKAGAKGGAAYGLGSSDADLTKGELGGAARDTAVGGGLGGAAGLVGSVINKPLQWLTGKATEAGRAALGRGEALANKPIDAAINSTRGALGGEVAAGSRGIEMAEKAAVNPRLPEDVSRAGADALSDTEVQALEERVARAQIGGLYGRLPRIEKAQGAFDKAVEGGSPEARAAALNELMSKSPMKRALGEILKRIGPTIAGASIGGTLGGNAGAGVGGTLGLLTGAMSGAPGRIVTNAVKSPQFQLSAADLGARAAGEMAPGALQGLITEQAGNPQSKLRESLAPYLELLEEKK